jgi:(1->4)-alpha-D-glucan 1-alpha-D-glucosylmutase
MWPEEPPQSQQWQALRKRVEQFMVKALREAKENTSWVIPNKGYEDAMAAFVKAVLTPGRKNRFLEDFVPFQRYVSRLGMWSSLSQILLKLTVPGVPDIYQGSELWDFRLVDPDNRTPVDYNRRRQLLDGLKANKPSANLARELLSTPEDGRIKLFLISKALNLRQQHSALFERGEYVPLAVEGVRSQNLCAFARTLQDAAVIVVAPHLVANIVGENGEAPIGEAVWGDTTMAIPDNLKDRTLTHLLSGERSIPSANLPLAEVLKDVPVALLATTS